MRTTTKRQALRDTVFAFSAISLLLGVMAGLAAVYLYTYQVNMARYYDLYMANTTAATRHLDAYAYSMCYWVAPTFGLACVVTGVMAWLSALALKDIGG